MDLCFKTSDVEAAVQEVVLRAASALSEMVKSVQQSLGIDGPVVLADGLLLNQAKLECAVRIAELELIK